MINIIRTLGKLFLAGVVIAQFTSGASTSFNANEEALLKVVKEGIPHIAVPIPSTDLSAFSPQALLREKEELNRKLWEAQVGAAIVRSNDTARQLSQLYVELLQCGIEQGKPVPYSGNLSNPDVMNKVFQADSLDYPLPGTLRTEPVGEYDKILGIEFFYGYLSTIGFEEPSTENLPFLPEIYYYRQTIAHVERLVSLASRPENYWVNHGEFAKYLAFCKDVLKKRDQLIDACLEHPEPANTRKYLLQQGVACYLLPHGGQKRELENEVGSLFSGNRANVLNLDRQFSNAMPEEAIQLRAQIIAVGLPGDKIVKKMWQQRPENGWNRK